MEKFYIGIDIGTNSVGMACTDENYKLLRAKGKDLWAVRLFDEAKPASDRRTKRAMRRRLMRRRKRIEQLQTLLAPLVAEKDDTFFIRLNNSPYFVEDKRGTDSRYVIFADDDYNDADFYREYPTIYHLRSALIRGTAKKDIRLYYIALHHMLKYRGNFLYEGQQLSEIRDINALFERLNAAIADVFDDSDETFDMSDPDEFKKTVTQKAGVRTKTAECEKLFGKVSSARKAMISLMVGGKQNASKLFGTEKGEGDVSLCFKNLEDAAYEAWAQEFTDEEFELLGALRNVYNYITFESVLGGHEYISDAMIALYEKHKEDLKKLKDLLRDHKDLYNAVFRKVAKEDKGDKKEKKEKASLSNYSAYVGFTKIGGNKIRCKRCASPEEFRKYIKKILTDNAEVLGQPDVIAGILADIESETFMPRLLNADNGVFPYQVNEAEMKAILKNAERDFSEFAEKDEQRLTISDKILSVLRFRIPYYVGPLNTYHADKGGNSWMVRREDGRITPWNFKEKVDLAASNEKFMRRMTNKCTYLHGKDVLPKCSPLYQRFDVLNQLNKLRIDDTPISVELKQSIFNDLFLTYKKVSDKKILDYLVMKGEVSEKGRKAVKLAGKDGDFKASMSTYITLKGILGDLADKNEQLCEDIVLWHTLNTDKGIVESLILDKYGDIGEVRENIGRLKALNFKDFGRFSRELLCGISGGVDENTGEVFTIIGELYKTNKNLNELLFADEYSFMDSIDEENGTGKTEITYEDIEELYVSPAVRRAIWQTLKMCDEYVAAVGRAPDKIFVEVTREKKAENKGKRTESRKAQLMKYLGSGTDAEKLRGELEGLTDADLRSKKLYLYFRQLGKCMYSGAQIDIGEILNKNSTEYDIDHIIPRSLSKDDSLDNTVLVKSTINRLNKKDTYPLPESCRPPEAIALWETLLAKGLISREKYARLTRRAELTADELAEFVNRQIVFTGQSAKAVAELLKRKYAGEGTRIVYSKASNVSDFRQRYGLVKCRETNDLHHARDAYLNIVVGNVYDTRFGSVYMDRRRDKTISESAIKKLFGYDISGAWDTQSTLALVKKTMSRFSMSVTRYSYIGTGAFYNETVYPAGDSGINAPRKENTSLIDTSKYGGYKSLNTAYFAIVASKGKKGKIVKTIEAVPVLVSYKTKDDKEKLREYFAQSGLIEPEILVPMIKKQSLLRYNGTPVIITGMQGKQITLNHAVQWFTDRDTDAYIKALQKCVGLIGADQMPGDRERYVVNKSAADDGITIDGESALALYDKMIEQLSRPVYGGLSGALNFLKNLKEKRDTFVSVSTYKKMKALAEILKFMNGKGALSDLTAIGLSPNAGKLLINKDVTDAEVEIVSQSPCGLRTVVRKL